MERLGEWRDGLVVSQAVDHFVLMSCILHSVIHVLDLCGFVARVSLLLDLSYESLLL